MKTHNEDVFTNISNPTVMDINPTPCLSSYKLSNDPSKTTSLHSIIHVYKMLVKSCTDNYAKSFGLVNGAIGIFEASTTRTNKTIFKIGALTKRIFLSLLL